LAIPVIGMVVAPLWATYDTTDYPADYSTKEATDAWVKIPVAVPVMATMKASASVVVAAMPRMAKGHDWADSEHNYSGN
jgi:hypothetical protein